MMSVFSTASSPSCFVCGSPLVIFSFTYINFSWKPQSLISCAHNFSEKRLSIEAVHNQSQSRTVGESFRFLIPDRIALKLGGRKTCLKWQFFFLVFLRFEVELVYMRWCSNPAYTKHGKVPCWIYVHLILIFSSASAGTYSPQLDTYANAVSHLVCLLVYWVLISQLCQASVELNRHIQPTYVQIISRNRSVSRLYIGMRNCRSTFALQGNVQIILQRISMC